MVQVCNWSINYIYIYIYISAGVAGHLPEVELLDLKRVRRLWGRKSHRQCRIREECLELLSWLVLVKVPLTKVTTGFDGTRLPAAKHSPCANWPLL